MARASEKRNGKLEEAMSLVLQTQAAMQQGMAALQQNTAALQQNQIAFTAQMAEMRAEADRRWVHTLEEFSRIRETLNEHTRMLAELTKASLVPSRGTSACGLPIKLRFDVSQFHCARH
jgi:hypothetical protein